MPTAIRATRTGDSRSDHADRHRAGSCQGQTRVRLLADAARQLHARRVAQRRARTGVLSARCRRQRRCTAAPSMSMAARTRGAHRFRAEPRRTHAPDAWPVDPVARARALGTGKSPPARTTTRTTSALTDGRAAGRRHGRRRTHRRSGRHRLARARAARHVAAGAPTAHTRSISACSTTLSNCRRWYRTPRDWIGGAAADRFSAFRGETQLQSVYAQDSWHFAATGARRSACA